MKRRFRLELGLVLLLSVALPPGMSSSYAYENSGADDVVTAAPDTAVFWSFSFSFFSGYRNWAGFDTTLQVVEGDTVAVVDTLANKFIKAGESEHAYYYVEQAVWGGRVDSAVVERLKTAFEDETPAAAEGEPGILSSTDGIYDKLTSIYGPPKDTDGDPKIYVVLMNVTDNAGTASPGPIMQGYFDPTNADASLEYSNARDMIYIDVDPANPRNDDVLKALAANFQRMLTWSVDATKVDRPPRRNWIEDGASSLSEFISGYGFRFNGWDPVSAYSLFPNVTDLSDFMYGLIRGQKSLLMQYIFEHYGIDVVKNLVSDSTVVGVRDMEQVIQAAGFSDTIEDLTTNLAVAYVLDLPQEEFYGGKYGIKYGDTKAPVTAAFWWGLDIFSDQPFLFAANQWNAIFVAHPRNAVDGILPGKSTSLNESIVVRGDPYNKYRLVEIRSPKLFVFPADENSIVLQQSEFDKGNRVNSTISGMQADPAEYETLIHVLVTFDERSAELEGTPGWVLTDDHVAPAAPEISFFQNAVYDNYVDVYTFSNERFYSADIVNENFDIDLISPDTTVGLSTEVFAAASTDTGGIYHSELVLEKSGNYTIKVSGRDLAGNPSPASETTLAVAKVAAQAGGSLTSADGVVDVSFPEHAFSRATFVSMARLSEAAGGLGKLAYSSDIGSRAPASLSATPVGSAYRIGPSRKLNSGALLRFSYTDSELAARGVDAEHLQVYRYDGERWVKLESIRSEGIISAASDRLGTFRLMAGDEPNIVENLPDRFALAQNYPNPFNAGTVINYQVPEASHVTLRIFNMLGQEVLRLVDRDHEAGFHTVKWDGRDAAGLPLSSGVYFYELTAKDFRDLKKLMYLR